MKVKTRITDYTVDDKTGRVVGGSKDKEKVMEYEYTLSRTKGTKTAEKGSDMAFAQCPHCGASVRLEQNAKCEYCGSVVESSVHGWVISAIKGISQTTL